MNLDFLTALKELGKEKGLDTEVLYEIVEAAMVSSYKKNFGNSANVRVLINKDTGDMKMFKRKIVVDETSDNQQEITLEEAQKIDPRYQLDDIIEIEMTPKTFGRVVAQNAKQFIMQRIRESERNTVYENFVNRENDIVTGSVNRIEHKNIYVDLGKAEALLPLSEQMPGEVYRHMDRIKSYILEVKKTSKGPQITISRSHPGLLKRLFELEVPEIHDGIVEIKSVAREPGSRSKISVATKNENLDAVGSCVGHKGMRVQIIVNELRGEKIDIVKYSTNPAEYIANALSPAKVIEVIVNEQEKACRVIVPDNQLSLAIGKEGQNARLAAKLTGWKIDIKSENQVNVEQNNNGDLE